MFLRLCTLLGFYKIDQHKAAHNCKEEVEGHAVFK